MYVNLYSRIGWHIPRKELCAAGRVSRMDVADEDRTIGSLDSHP